MSPKRLHYIDIAKGIGILLVALAHNDLAGYAPFLYHWIYSFHMPLFFFLSGLFFKYLGNLGGGPIVGATGTPRSGIQRRHAEVVHDVRFRAVIDQILGDPGPAPLYRSE